MNLPIPPVPTRYGAMVHDDDVRAFLESLRTQSTVLSIGTLAPDVILQRDTEAEAEYLVGGQTEIVVGVFIPEGMQTPAAGCRIGWAPMWNGEAMINAAFVLDNCLEEIPEEEEE
jgi:hypothetical protein